MIRLIIWTIIMAIAGPMSFTLWYIPFTLQSLMVLLAGWYLGLWRGLTALMVYLSLGAVGLPVFANYTSGWERLYGPGAGFFLSLTFIIVLAGGVGHYIKTDRWRDIILLNFTAQFLYFTLGLSWMALYFFSEDFYDRYMFPAIPGTIFKVFAGTLVVKIFKR